ncbi:MAG: glycosyltransferase, partial [Pseudobutyrivibrio sp.]|nr:glycosyltransferase [Pseudobutyrivibrio sp.]
LPVISTDMCIAAVELVENDTNGFVVPVEDAGALVKAVNKVLESEEKREAMGRASLERIRWYTFESMAKVHLDYFEEEKD